MDTARMETTLLRLVEATNLVYLKEPFWRVNEMILMPPAECQEIELLSKNCPFSLPPSYAQFLKLHDGCLNFWPRFTLLGTKGEPKEIVRAEVEDARQHQSQFAADDLGNVTKESIQKFETLKETTQLQYFFLPSHTVFGTNRGGEFFVFNEKKMDSHGEYEVVHYTYSGGAHYRYPDFPSFLISTLESVEKRIKEKHYLKKKK